MKLWHQKRAHERLLTWLLVAGTGYALCLLSVNGQTRYGPHPAADSSGPSRHAYSPFEQLERKRQEMQMPRPESVADRVLIKMADEAGIVARSAGAAREALSIDGLESLERLFPRAKGKPKSLAAPLGSTTDTPDLSLWIDRVAGRRGDGFRRSQRA
jgi:hypothetical protein